MVDIPQEGMRLTVRIQTPIIDVTHPQVTSLRSLSLVDRPPPQSHNPNPNPDLESEPESIPTPSRKRISRSKASLQTAKRQKYNEAGYERHKKFWHSDGNVVIRVEKHLFRVHSSVLESKSVFFVQLFMGETEDSEDIDGCRVFDLDGKKCHFTALMDAFYGGM